MKECAIYTSPNSNTSIYGIEKKCDHILGYYYHEELSGIGRASEKEKILEGKLELHYKFDYCPDCGEKNEAV